MTTNFYNRNLDYDIYDEGELHNVDVLYAHHYQKPEYNSWDSRDDYYGENHVEVYTVMLNDVLVDGEWGELEQTLLEEFKLTDGDF
jgi:hypothetical protein